MPEENAVPKANPDKSRGELSEGRPHPTKDTPAGDYPTENPLGNKAKAEKSQLEGPAAYAPLPDEQSSADEAREKRDKEDQGFVRDERGQSPPADRNKAQQTSSRKQHGQSDPPIENTERVDRDPAKAKESSNSPGNLRNHLQRQDLDDRSRRHSRGRLRDEGSCVRGRLRCRIKRDQRWCWRQNFHSPARFRRSGYRGPVAGLRKFPH